MIFTADMAIRTALGKAEPFEVDRLRDGFGWWCEDMHEPWARLWTAITGNYSDFFHALINLPVEYVRLDVSRGVKLLVFDQAVVWLILLCALLWQM